MSSPLDAASCIFARRCVDIREAERVELLQLLRPHRRGELAIDGFIQNRLRLGMGSASFVFAARSGDAPPRSVSMVKGFSRNPSNSRSDPSSGCGRAHREEGRRGAAEIDADCRASSLPVDSGHLQVGQDDVWGRRAVCRVRERLLRSRRTPQRTRRCFEQEDEAPRG